MSRQQEQTSRSGQSYLDDGVEMEPSQDQNDSPQKAYYQEDSNLNSNNISARAISMTVSGPMSGNRNENEMIERSAQASSFPLQMQQQQQQQQPPGPSPLVRQLSEKVRFQAERLQIMEAYKALCEQRILDFDQEHPLPVMPYHLGTGNIGGQMEQTGPADLRRQLALKEQDLQYTKQRNEKLQRELSELKNGGQTGGNFEALRKEIEINEKLQKQIEVYQQQLGQPSSREHKTTSIRADSLASDSKSMRSNIDPQNVINQLKEQVDALMDEKNALLDYIEENMDKNQSLSSKKQDSHSKDTIDRLSQRNIQLQQQVEDMTFQFNELKAQNEQLLKNQYVSPGFGENPYNDNLPESIHDAEGTFGQKMFEETKSQFLKEKEALSVEIENYQSRVKQLEKELQDAKEPEPTARSQQMSQRSHRSDIEGSCSKKKCRDLEFRLKATQENTKTLSETLNETQAELEQLIKDHDKLNSDYQAEVSQLQDINSSNHSLISQLKEEKEQLTSDLQACHSSLKAIEKDLLLTQKEAQREKEKAQQYEKHIKDLKAQEGQRIESVTLRWEETVGDLSRELENAKKVVQEKEDIYKKMQEDLQRKAQGIDNGQEQKTKLLERIEDLSAEVKMLKDQKQEKDAKLKNQIKKNEELLGELQDLSEAVNALKNDQEFTVNSQLLEEKDQIIQEYQHFINNKQKRSIDRIFTTILKSVEKIREFSKIHKTSNLVIFDQIDKSLQNIARVQEQEFSIPVLENMFKDLENLMVSLHDWNTLIIDHFKSKVTELNETQKQLFQETDCNKTLQDQMKRLQMEETEIHHKDQQMEQECHNLNMTLLQREREMKDMYKREEKLQRQNQKLKLQLDTLIKEQEKLVMQIKAMMKEKERLVHENDQCRNDQEKDEGKVRVLEFQLSSMQGHMDALNDMVDNLKNAMPSQDLQRLVQEMQDVTNEQFKLSEQFSNKENTLISMENQLRQFAKQDTGLSQKVIALRKEIQKYREELKQIQVQKIQLSDKNEEIVDLLKNCETMERRRHDVALETEKSLTEAKERIKEQQKEIMFVNSNRKDLEIAVMGLQEQNGMLQREITSIRQQLKAGTWTAQNSLGGSLAKMKRGSESQRSSAQVSNAGLPPTYVQYAQADSVDGTERASRGQGTTGTVESVKYNYEGGIQYQGQPQYVYIPNQFQVNQSARDQYSQISHTARDQFSPPQVVNHYQPPYHPLNINSSDKMLLEQNPNTYSGKFIEQQASVTQSPNRHRSMSLGHAESFQAKEQHHHKQDPLFINDFSGINSSKVNQINHQVSEQKKPFSNSVSDNFSESGLAQASAIHQSHYVRDGYPPLQIQHRQIASEYQNNEQAHMSSFDKNQRITLSEKFNEVEQNVRTRNQFNEYAMMDSRSRSKDMKNPTGGSGENEYGTFGGLSHEKVQQLSTHRNNITVSPSMPNIGQSKQLPPRPIQNQQVYYPQPHHQPEQSSRANNNGSGTGQTIRSVAEPVHISKQTVTTIEDDDDSFKSDGNNDDAAENSLMIESELLEGNDQRSVENTQNPSSLQTKLSQVKSVFSAIRQNLNDGSTEKSQNY